MCFFRRHHLTFVVLSILIAAFAVWRVGVPKWLATPTSSLVSPDGRYRLDILTAYYLTSLDYGFVRVYDNRTGAFMCESGVEWMNDGAGIHWPVENQDKLLVGMSTRLAFSADGRRCWVPLLPFDISWPLPMLHASSVAAGERAS